MRIRKKCGGGGEKYRSKKAWWFILFRSWKSKKAESERGRPNRVRVVRNPSTEDPQGSLNKGRCGEKRGIRWLTHPEVHQDGEGNPVKSGI